MSTLKMSKEEFVEAIKDIPAFSKEHGLAKRVKVSYEVNADGDILHNSISGTLLNAALNFGYEKEACKIIELGGAIEPGLYTTEGWFGWDQSNVHPLEAAAIQNFVSVTKMILDRGVDFKYVGSVDSDAWSTWDSQPTLYEIVSDNPEMLATLKEAGWKPTVGAKSRPSSVGMGM